jgi:hypothetical protein
MKISALVAVAAAVVLVFAGCGGSSAPSASSIVSRSAAETAKQKSFHVVVGIDGAAATSKTGLTLTFADGDVLVPGKMSARVGGSFLGIPLRSQLVVVGANHWLRNPLSGSWQKVSIGLGPETFFNSKTGVLPVIRAAHDLKVAGSEQVGAVDTYRLTGKVPAGKIAPLVGAKAATNDLVPIELWIGKRDSLLYRVRVDGPLAAGDAKDATRTVELSNFGEHVAISAPPGT